MLFRSIGIGAGSVIFAYFFPWLESFYNTSAMGGVTLPQLMHVNPWFIVILVMMIAVAMFVMLERFEKHRRIKRGEENSVASSTESPVRPQGYAKKECTSTY